MNNLRPFLTNGKSPRGRCPLNFLALMAIRPTVYDDYCKKNRPGSRLGVCKHFFEVAEEEVKEEEANYRVEKEESEVKV